MTFVLILISVFLLGNSAKIKKKHKKIELLPPTKYISMVYTATRFKDIILPITVLLLTGK